jgi:hypothetical protein
MRVEGGLAAHFKTADGGSRPGVHWKIALKRGDEIHTVLVKAFLTPDATRATQRDQEYQAQTVMQYLNDQLHAGWHPEQQRDHVIHIGNPLPGTRPSPKPWWRIW